MIVYLQKNIEQSWVYGLVVEALKIEQKLRKYVSLKPSKSMEYFKILCPIMG